MSRLFRRLRLVACHVWGVAPWELDRAVELEELALEDVLEAVALEGAHMEIDVGAYLFREAREAREARAEEIIALARMAELEPDEEKRAAYLERMRVLNHG